MKSNVLVILTVLALGVGPPAPAQSAASSLSVVAEGGVPLGQLLESVAKRSGKKILVDPRVPENLPVHLYGQDTSKVDYDELLTILDLDGFAAVEQGGYVQIVPHSEVRYRSIPLVTGSENLPLAQYVTTLIRVKSISATQLVPILRPMLPQQSHLVALPCRNVLIMVDTMANVRRIKTVIEGLDTGAPWVDKCSSSQTSDRPQPPPPPPPRPDGPGDPGL